MVIFYKNERADDCDQSPLMLPLAFLGAGISFEARPEISAG